MVSAEREALAKRVLGFAGAGAAAPGETEALVSDGDHALTRFTHNAIHQNLAAIDTSVRIRTVIDGRTGVASTNRLDDDNLRDAVQRARGMAEHAPQGPAFPGLPLPAATPAAPTNAFVEATAAANPERRAAIAAEIFETAERDGLWAAGYVRTSSDGITIANSRGTLVSFDSTDCGLNVKQNGEDSTGFAEQYSTDVASLNGGVAGGIAAKKAVSSRAPVAVDPGEWTVILEPPAFGELLAYLADHFSAQSYDEGSSFLSDGLGKPCVGQNVTIFDDYSHPLAPGMPFDFEGVPKQRIALIEGGLGAHVVTDSYWAAKLGMENTGHALPAPNVFGPEPRNIVVVPGTKTTEELIAETERGLLVSRFWYIRTVDQRQTIVTGMTRDGTFLIERGKLTKGARNMRFNQSILTALRNVQFSSGLMRTGGYSYSMVVPTAKIEGFRFTSQTQF